MKKRPLTIIVLAFTLLLFFGLSLAPCIQYEASSSSMTHMIIGDFESEAPLVTIRFSSYMPQVIGLFVLIQLLMLLLKPRVVYRVIGLVMTLLCAVVPLPLLIWLNKFLSDVFSYTGTSYRNYRPTYVGWLLWSLGLAIILLYISEIRFIRQSRARAAAAASGLPAQAPDPAPADPTDQAAILAAMQQENQIFNYTIQNDKQGGKHHE